jgi:apolipoprotein N-acyltransferase
MMDEPPEFYTADYRIVDVALPEGTPGEAPLTFYTRFGDWFAMLCLAAAAAAAIAVIAAAIIRRQSRAREEPET